MANLAVIKQLAKDGKLDELRALAVSQGLNYHPRMKADTVAKLILDKVANPVKQEQTLKHAAEKPKLVEAVTNTQEQIRAACKAYLDKPGFEATFNEDGTWHFRYRGAEDSGHMTVPLRIIQRKAQSVSEGRRQLMGVAEDFGKIPGAEGKNAYTNVVLNA